MTNEASGELLLLLTPQGVPLGRLWVQERAFLGVRCRFEAMPAFEAYRAPFEEEHRLTEYLVKDDSPETFAEAEAALDRLQALGLRLRRQDGTMHRHFLLAIHGQEARLQLLPVGAEH